MSTGFPDLWGNSVSAVDDAFAVWNFFHAVHKNGAFFLQFLDNKAVVDDFLANINRRPEGFERDSYDVDGAHDSSTKAPRLQKQKLLVLTLRHNTLPSRYRLHVFPEIDAIRLSERYPIG